MRTKTKRLLWLLLVNKETQDRAPLVAFGSFDRTHNDKPRCLHEATKVCKAVLVLAS